MLILELYITFSGDHISSAPMDHTLPYYSLLLPIFLMNSPRSRSRSAVLTNRSLFMQILVSSGVGTWQPYYFLSLDKSCLIRMRNMGRKVRSNSSWWGPRTWWKDTGVGIGEVAGWAHLLWTQFVLCSRLWKQDRHQQWSNRWGWIDRFNSHTAT